MGGKREGDGREEGEGGRVEGLGGKWEGDGMMGG